MSILHVLGDSSLPRPHHPPFVHPAGSAFTGVNITPLFIVIAALIIAGFTALVISIVLDYIGSMQDD